MLRHSATYVCTFPTLFSNLSWDTGCYSLLRLSYRRPFFRLYHKTLGHNLIYIFSFWRWRWRIRIRSFGWYFLKNSIVDFFKVRGTKLGQIKILYFLFYLHSKIFCEGNLIRNINRF